MIFSLGLEAIGSVSVDGSGYKEIKTEGGLIAFALVNKVLVWITKKGTLFGEVLCSSVGEETVTRSYHLKMFFFTYSGHCCLDSTKCWYSDDEHTGKLWFEVDADIVSLKAFAKSRQKGGEIIT